MAYADAHRLALLPNVRPLDCPDCGEAGALRLDWKPESVGGSSRVVYACVTPRCRGTLPARADGSPVGTPADARTRSGRRVLQERLGRIWRQADVVASEMLVAAGKRPLRTDRARKVAQAHGRALLYRWVAWTLKRDSSKSRVTQMDGFDLSTIAAACDTIKDDFRAIVAWSKTRRKGDAKPGGTTSRSRAKAAHPAPRGGRSCG
jgi:hypothetical protein